MNHYATSDVCAADLRTSTTFSAERPKK